MSEQNTQAPAPVVKDERYVNAQPMLGDKDEQGNRELSFFIGGPNLMTFILNEPTQNELAERLGEKKATDELVVAQPGDTPPLRAV